MRALHPVDVHSMEEDYINTPLYHNHHHLVRVSSSIHQEIQTMPSMSSGISILCDLSAHQPVVALDCL